MTNKREKDNEIFERWIIQNNLAETTARTYKSLITHYTTATGMTLTELYNEAIEDEENHVPLYRKRVNNHIFEFQAWLQQQKFTESTKRKALQTVGSFYNFIGVPMLKIKTNYSSDPDTENVGKSLTKEIIQIMMNNSNVKEKSIISMMTLTGQAQNEVRNMKIENLINAYNTALNEPIFTIDDLFDKQKEILNHTSCKLNMYRQKTKYSYFTYIPSETSKLIFQYLHERNESKNNKIRIKNIDDFLFVTKQGKQYQYGSIGTLILNIGKKCGFNKPEQFEPRLRELLTRKPGKHNIFKSHNFRKYFINTCRRYAGTTSENNTGIIFSGLELANFWTGHKPEGAIQYYIQYNNTDYVEMQKQYEQALPYLSLETNVRTFDTRERKEFEKLKKDYSDLQQEVEDLKKFLKYKSLLDDV